ncbi:uncharacterized protein [Dermacentor andersoni]
MGPSLSSYRSIVALKPVETRFVRMAMALKEDAEATGSSSSDHEKLAMHPGYEFTTETNRHLRATGHKVNSINAQNHEQGLAMHPGSEFTTETNGHLLATGDKINSINAQNHEQGLAMHPG